MKIRKRISKEKAEKILLNIDNPHTQIIHTHKVNTNRENILTQILHKDIVTTNTHTTHEYTTQKHTILRTYTDTTIIHRYYTHTNITHTPEDGRYDTAETSSRRKQKTHTREDPWKKKEYPYKYNKTDRKSEKQPLVLTTW